MFRDKRREWGSGPNPNQSPANQKIKNHFSFTKLSCEKVPHKNPRTNLTMSTSTVLPEFDASPPSWTAQRKASAKAGSSSSAHYLARHQLQLRRVAAGSGNGYGPLNHPNLTRSAPQSSRRQDEDDGTGNDGDEGDDESDDAGWCSSITSMLVSFILWYS